MPKKFDQEAKDRIVRLVEDSILADGGEYFDAGSMQDRGTQTGRFVAHSEAMDAGRST